ncbi:NADH-quinone oxidoreductase subunit N [Amycolatopsis sp. H20-H5]|uniref:NADH-quinone oxidoreductase subunit N n=1 Tax=Amycolatopsis sp. H20-H5 TaxID=3046309 RepID=UPI002DB96089|nr:NADH-quinone oxidoreductase subunit N [Amycolatopsis sp. H20-H5]MEC3974413.1 NADH-quinone oxidoreductase subunit N [Amycolatopsis sp. H20-H5]
MNETPGALLPELLLLAGAVFGLLTGLFLPRRRQWIVAVVAALAMVGSIVAAALDLAREPQRVFDDSYAVDVPLGVVRIGVATGTLLVLALSVAPVRGHRRETEYYVLLLFGALGTIMMAGAADVLLLMVTYLLASIPLYTLAAFHQDARGTEAALKYFLNGALLGVLMLFGLTLLYGAGGATAYGELGKALPGASQPLVAVGLVLTCAGLAFKLGGVPAHFWVPDVAEGASAPVAAYVTTLPKIGAAVALLRLVTEALPGVRVDWSLLIAIIAAASMTLGNLAAFWQQSPTRLLAYSTISQIGYLLMAVAAALRSELATPALLYYLAAYLVTNLAAFAVVVALPRAQVLGDYAGLARRHRALAVVLLVSLLSLIGIPPLAGFVGKLGVFAAAMDAGLAWLVVLAALNTVASVFYYLRWLAPAFLDSRQDGEPDKLADSGSSPRITAYVAALLTVVLGPAGGLLYAVL